MGGVFGGAENQDLDMEAREQLVEDCLLRLQDAHEEALQAGISDPVVFLIDCEDSVGTTIARNWEGDDAVDSAILANAECEHDGGRETIATVLTRAVSFQESQRDVPGLFPLPCNLIRTTSTKRAVFGDCCRFWGQCNLLCSFFLTVTRGRLTCCAYAGRPIKTCCGTALTGARRVPIFGRPKHLFSVVGRCEKGFKKVYSVAVKTWLLMRN